MPCCSIKDIVPSGLIRNRNEQRSLDWDGLNLDVIERAKGRVKCAKAR
jgi:hypothetical protein